MLLAALFGNEERSLDASQLGAQCTSEVRSLSQDDRRLLGMVLHVLKLLPWNRDFLRNDKLLESSADLSCNFAALDDVSAIAQLIARVQAAEASDCKAQRFCIRQQTDFSMYYNWKNDSLGEMHSCQSTANHDSDDELISRTSSEAASSHMYQQQHNEDPMEHSYLEEIDSPPSPLIQSLDLFTSPATRMHPHDPKFYFANGVIATIKNSFYQFHKAANLRQ
eukprot:gnl/TRDRNA2_/TRDRNA2_170821_c3_seq2.p1 gnl/TRDRNA2_/TRDRNA2_170821_c3~~gnl/TRDRNA2_/TRDRNA2_170821_c3_seq2.p1  ORF type:complete len:235 (+),score=38.08 gnl/TRDRNA2_/TRDRNA2_170821_c3_seq2:41-706(+)